MGYSREYIVVGHQQHEACDRTQSLWRTTCPQVHKRFHMEEVMDGKRFFGRSTGESLQTSTVICMSIDEDPSDSTVLAGHDECLDTRASLKHHQRNSWTQMLPQVYRQIGLCKVIESTWTGFRQAAAKHKTVLHENPWRWNISAKGRQHSQAMTVFLMVWVRFCRESRVI